LGSASLGALPGGGGRGGGGRGRTRRGPHGVAATDAPGAQPGATQRAVGLERLDGVLRARRGEAARGGVPARTSCHPRHTARSARAPAHHTASSGRRRGRPGAGGDVSASRSAAAARRSSARRGRAGTDEVRAGCEVGGDRGHDGLEPPSHEVPLDRATHDLADRIGDLWAHLVAGGDLERRREPRPPTRAGSGPSAATAQVGEGRPLTDAPGAAHRGLAALGRQAGATLAAPCLQDAAPRARDMRWLNPCSWSDGVRWAGRCASRGSSCDRRPGRAGGRWVARSRRRGAPTCAAGQG
jgi:hypothetical protein